MDEFLKTCLIVCPLVFLGGFVDSVAGGGGIITIPAYLLAGIPVHLASGTNKVVNGSGAIIASFKYLRGGHVRIRPALIAAALALVGSALGTRAAALFSEATLQTLLLIALPCVAIFLTVKKNFGTQSPDAPPVSRTREAVASALIGLVFGCYDGMIGPGTGTFMLMGFAGLLSYDLLTASACARVSNLSSNLASAVVWIMNGQVMWRLALPAVLCSILGNYCGARYAIRGGGKNIRGMIFLVLGLLFAKMLWELLT